MDSIPQCIVLEGKLIVVIQMAFVAFVPLPAPQKKNNMSRFCGSGDFFLWISMGTYG